MLREMLRMEKLCAAIGFTKEMIESLLTKKEAIRCNGRMYSEEHRRKFDIKNDVFKVEKNPADDEKLGTDHKQATDWRMVQGAYDNSDNHYVSLYSRKGAKE